MNDGDLVAQSGSSLGKLALHAYFYMGDLSFFPLLANLRAKQR